MGSDQTVLTQAIPSDENLRQMILDGMSSVMATMNAIIRYHEETDTWERLEDNFEITKTNIRSVLHNARLLQKFLNDFSDDNINVSYKTVLDSVTWGSKGKVMNPQHAELVKCGGPSPFEILGTGRQSSPNRTPPSFDTSSWGFFNWLTHLSIGLDTSTITAEQLPNTQIGGDPRISSNKIIWDPTTHWLKYNEIDRHSQNSDKWHEFVTAKTYKNPYGSFASGDKTDASRVWVSLFMSDNEIRESIGDMATNVGRLNELVYRHFQEGTFSRGVEDFFIQAVTAKISGNETPEMLKMLTFIDDYIEITEKIKPNEVFGKLISHLHKVLSVANKIVESNRTSEYLFFLTRAYQTKYYSPFVAKKLYDEDTYIWAIPDLEDLVDKVEDETWLSPTRYPDPQGYGAKGPAFYKDKSWKSLRKINDKKTKVVFDHNAKDKHPNSPTTYLGTNSDSARHLAEAISEVNEFYSEFETSNLQRKSIVDFMYCLFSDDMSLWERVKDSAVDEEFFFGATWRGYEADEGWGDSATNVPAMKILIDDDAENMFGRIFVEGASPEDDPSRKKYCKPKNPLYTIFEDLLPDQIEGLRHILAQVEIGKRLKIVKSSIEEFQGIDDITWQDAEITNYENLLSSNGLFMSLSFRKYYDLIQPKGKTCINNKYEPITEQEERAMHLLFTQNKYLQHKTSEYTKVITVAIDKNDVKNQRYVEVTLTKTNKLNPFAKYEPKKFIIDTYLHPVFNGYVMHDTAISNDNELSNEYIDSGEFEIDDYNTFYSLVVNGMKFIDYHKMLESSSSILPRSYEAALNAVSDFAPQLVTGTSRYNAHEKILKDAVEDKILTKYLFSLLSFSFDTETLSSEFVDHDAGSNDKLDALIFHHNDFDVLEYNSRAKAVLLENSSYFNNKRIIKDILGVNNDIGLTFNIVVDLIEDFALVETGGYIQIDEGDPSKDDVENIQIEATAMIVHSEDL